MGVVQTVAGDMSGAKYPAPPIRADACGSASTVTDPLPKQLTQQRTPLHFSESTRPLTNHFCITITTSAGGSMASMAVAMTTFHSV